MTDVRRRVSAFLSQNYFTLSILFCIGFARLAPWLGARGGPLVPEITVKYVAVCVIFYTSGLTVKWSELSGAVRQVHLHAFVQAFSFVVVPIFMQVFVTGLRLALDLNVWISKGFLTVACMPPPVSSAVILTKSGGGNEAAAIFNSALGSVLGIFLTPLLLLLHVGSSSSVPFMKTFLHLSQTMILPVFLGLISQKVIRQQTLSSIPFSKLGQISLLLIIYSSFCDMFSQEGYNIDAGAVLWTVMLVVLIQVLLVLVVFKISGYFGRRSRMNLFSPQDVITITFCSTQKSLTLGLPLLKTVYGGYPYLSQISLPLLIYHPVQLILGGFLVPHCRKWLKSQLSGSYKRP